MDFHLERTLRLKTHEKIEHKNLYQHAIVELDDRGEQVGGDMIPWGWTLNFKAIELAVTDRFQFESQDLRGRDLENKTIAHTSTIQAKLRPGGMREDKTWGREPTYRFFGTDRVISEFLIDIMAETADQPAGCTTWGSVSYISEIDFHRDTTDDIVQFYMMVPQATYDRYLSNIAQGMADDLYLSVGFIEGFYSEWSPSISTREIKVLAGSEHVIEDANGVEMPRLGKVGKAELFIHARRNLTRPEAPVADEPQYGEPEEELRGFWCGRRG